MSEARAQEAPFPPTRTAAGPAAELLAWYARHRRDLPWRATRDPYRVLVSEVMLQQTQVDRVLGYYERWLTAFPDARVLADAPAEAVHRLWKGLGYPNRADRLQAACRVVVRERGGVWPAAPESLQELPGIGPYTAGAVACFAFGAAVPLVDTNVARVYARRDGLPLPLDRKELWRHAGVQVPPADAISYNNALMELGALVCTARRPECPACPWRARCASAGLPAEAPDWTATGSPLKAASPQRAYGVAIRDRAKPRLHIVLGLIHHEGLYLVARRPAGVAEGGRWELPGGKRESGEDDRRALARELREELAVEVLAARPFVSWNHDAGARYLSFHCSRCRLFDPGAARPLAASELRWVAPAEFLRLDFPAANGPILDRFKNYHRL